MPDRPSDRQLAPWEAVLAQALQQDEPERTALEEMQAAQDWTTNTGHLLELSEAYWRLDVVPQIDEMVRQRVSPREYERYRQDPERPALLQALRAHEIGGRRIEDSLDAITAEPMTGLRSIAAGLHGRLGKEPPPARGETRTWAERAPQNAPEPVREAARMLDARQAELGRQLAERPPRWALEAWGVPPGEPGALRDDWERRAGIVGSYREAAGITDPAQAIGPVPSGQAQLREAFHASVVALALPDDQALLRAMGRGELEATVAAHDRAAALAPPDVQAEIGEREREWEDAQVRAHIAGYDMDAEAAAEAETDAGAAAQDLSRLAVADAARREWAEAHAGKAEAARDAERELRRRGQADPGPHAETDAEFDERLARMVEEAEAANPSPGRVPEIRQPEPGPLPEAMTDAEFNAHLEEMVAAAEGREPRAQDAEAEALPRPMTDAEFDAYLDQLVAADAARREAARSETEAGPTQAQPEPEPRPEAEPDQAAMYEEIHEDLQQIGRDIRELSDRMDIEDARRAEVRREIRDEPQAQAQAGLEPSWQPGEAVAEPAEAAAGMDMEAEI